MKHLPGEPSEVAGVSFAADQLAMNIHGDVDSHIDALCHVGYNGTLYNGVAFPVHVLAINALGMYLLDYLQFDDLISHCNAAGRWSFLCVVAPVRLPGGTGSPVNPIAIL